MRQECRECFPHHRFRRKPLVSDTSMHYSRHVRHTHVPWCMSGSLTHGDGENVPGIRGACAPAILRIWQEAHRARNQGFLVPLVQFWWPWREWVSSCHADKPRVDARTNKRTHGQTDAVNDNTEGQNWPRIKFTVISKLTYMHFLIMQMTGLKWQPRPRAIWRYISHGIEMLFISLNLVRWTHQWLIPLAKGQGWGLLKPRSFISPLREILI